MATSTGSSGGIAELLETTLQETAGLLITLLVRRYTGMIEFETPPRLSVIS